VLSSLRHRARVARPPELTRDGKENTQGSARRRAPKEDSCKNVRSRFSHSLLSLRVFAAGRERRRQVSRSRIRAAVQLQCARARTARGETHGVERARQQVPWGPRAICKTNKREKVDRWDSIRRKGCGWV
jgi:hypothetical protein